MSILAGAAFLLLACARGNGAPAAGPFDGARALAYAGTFMAFGPRVPGTEAHRQAGDWIVREMRQRADTVVEQTWTHTLADGKTIPMRNILARFRPAAGERILYVTHWDSRPRAERARDAAQRTQPTPGANDGASGVGLFLALGDLLKAMPPSVGVDLLFVDGEDWGEFGPPEVDVLIGSRYFAAHLPDSNYRPLFGVVWDMIGDADLQIYQEYNSVDRAPEVVSHVWDAAAALGYSDVFRPQPKYTVTDDHIPLLDAGLRVIDVIDLDYASHHTPEDTMDKISARSLKIVGDVAWRLLQR